MKRSSWLLLPLSFAAVLLMLPAGCKSTKTESSDSSDTTTETGPNRIQLAAMRSTSSNNLKQIGLGMHNHNDATRGLPLGAICDQTGKPLLSWRVALLPFVDGGKLYKQFKLNEPWDSPNNQALLTQIPKVYQTPGRTKDPTHTHYRVFTAAQGTTQFRTMFPWPVAGRGVPQPHRIETTVDGTSNTIMVVEAEAGVPWTKPDELMYTDKGPLPKLAYFYNGSALVLLGDGSVRQITQKLPEQTLRLLITMDDGMIANWE